MESSCMCAVVVSAQVTQPSLEQASRYRRKLLFLVTAACDQQRNASTQTCFPVPGYGERHNRWLSYFLQSI
jgi:hypothetical protein